MKKFLIRTGLVSGIALMALALLLTAAMHWKKHVREKNVINSLAFAEDYIRQDEPVRALRLVDEYRKTRDNFPEYEKKWVALELDAAINVPDYPRLEMIYHEYPVIFAENPDSALVLARYFLMRGKYSQYDSLRNESVGSSPSNSHTWLILDADKELQAGNKATALEILEKMPPRPTGDAARLIRMAMILSENEPERALQHLRKAIELEPDNPESCLAMANFLERQGHSAEARNFYVTAAVRADNNPFFADQLAEFYIRNGKYSHAISTWQSIPEKSRGPLQLMKLMAWSKLTVPGTLPDAEEPGISLIRYSEDWTQAFSLLTSSPNENPGQLTDDNALYGYPLLLWCEILQSLRNGDYLGARSKLMDKYGAISSVHPDLALAILMVLEIRLEDFSPGIMKFVRIYKQSPNAGMNIALRHLVQDYELIVNSYTDGISLENSKAEFWAADNIFALLFSSVGWAGAADEWYKDPAVRNEISQLPAWAMYAHIKSLLIARSQGSDYNLIELIPSSISDTSINLLRAEIHLAEKNYTPALKYLVEISRQHNDFGVRAGWLTGLIYLEKGRLGDVQKLIDSSPYFRASIRGREIEAKLKLARSEPSSALEIYRTIRDKSPEAQAFLYDYYRNAGDTVQAQKLREEILSSNINEPTLWNLVSK